MKNPSAGARRRLIAGLRVTPHDEELLEAVRPLFPEAGSAGELAYRLWRRGLELSLAEAASLGVALPRGADEAAIAGLVAQRLLLSMPLLRRAGTIAALGIVAPVGQAGAGLPGVTPPAAADPQAIDDGAAGAIVSLGGGEFL